MDEFKVLNQTYESRKKGAFTLLHARGSCGSKADFMVSIDTLTSSPLHLAPQGGRSSDNTALPFFNLMAPGQQRGVLVAVGWTGGWQANLAVSTTRQSLCIQAWNASDFISSLVKRSVLL